MCVRSVCIFIACDSDAYLGQCDAMLSTILADDDHDHDDDDTETGAYYIRFNGFNYNI